MNSLNANVSGRKIKFEWADFSRPDEAPDVIITQTSLLELIGAIDEVLEEENTPEKDEFVRAVLSHLLQTGRIQFNGRLKNCRVEIE